MSGKKQIQAIFKFKFKMICKAVETTYNINNTLDPETAKEHTQQWWFKKFCKGDKNLEDEECNEKKLQSTSQSQTCTKKGHGHCLLFCCQSDPLQLSESQWNHFIWEVCSANRWDALKAATFEAGIGQQNGPNSPRWCQITCHKPTLEKLDKLDYKFLPYLPYSPDLSPTDYCFYKHLDNFLPEKCFQNQQEAENAFQEFTESKAWIFFLLQEYMNISSWQKCVDCNSSYFD